MKRLLLSLFLACGLATSSMAFTGTDVLNNKHQPVMKGWLNGVAQALTFANQMNRVDGSPMLFCIPDSITFTADLAAQAVRTGIDMYGNSYPPAMLALVGMEEMFPCM